jgi:hypothetical protein
MRAAKGNHERAKPGSPGPSGKAARRIERDDKAVPAAARPRTEQDELRKAVKIQRDADAQRIRARKPRT